MARPSKKPTTLKPERASSGSSRSRVADAIKEVSRDTRLLETIDAIFEKRAYHPVETLIDISQDATEDPATQERIAKYLLRLQGYSLAPEERSSGSGGGTQTGSGTFNLILGS